MKPSPTAPAAVLRPGLRPQHLIMLTFLLQAMAFGSWLPRIPEVQARLGLGPADLALALLGLPAGLILVMPFAGPIVSRIGGRAAILYSLPAFLCAMALPAFSMHVVMLFTTLVLCGMAMSLVELGMNVVADEIERSHRVAIMSRCHGCWSLGMAIGSLTGAGMATGGLSPHLSVLLVSLASLPFGLLVVRRLPAVEKVPAAVATGPVSGLFIPGLLLAGICIVGLGSNLVEGAAADWSAVYLTDVFGADVAAAGLGYTGYALMMALGRFGGDWMRMRWGPVLLIRACYAIATLGVALVVFSPVYPLALLGFALAGFGGSVGVPLAVSAAASLNDRPAANNVAMLTLVSLIGFLSGPVIVGFIAEGFGLRVGLGVLLLPVLIAAILVSGTLRGQPRGAASTSTR